MKYTSKNDMNTAVQSGYLRGLTKTRGERELGSEPRANG